MHMYRMTEWGKGGDEERLMGFLFVLNVHMGIGTYYNAGISDIRLYVHS